MTAVLTVNKNSNLILLDLRIFNLAHACILPRVFYGVSINYIISCDIKASELINIVLNSRLTD